MATESTRPKTKYLLKSTLVLLVSLFFSFLALQILQDIPAHPDRYLLYGTGEEELRLYITLASAFVVGLSFTLALYAFGTSKERTDLAVWEATVPLALSKEQFRRLYDAAPVPYVTLDERGTIHNPNKAALRFFEGTPESLEGKNLFSFAPVGDEKHTKHAALLLEYYKRNTPVDRQEVLMTTAKGTERWVSLSIFEMKDAASPTRTGLATLFDITEQKRLDQAKTEFVSLASHQLRTPIATTKWFTDMLLSGDLGPLAPKQKEYVQRIFTTNEGMIELVDTLLNVSRVEIGTLPTVPAPTNVQELVESILAELAPQIAKKEQVVVKQYTAELKNISTDPKLLRIVIQNLISNAVKYTPQKGTITVTLVEGASGRQIIVADTGYGIPAGQQGRVFSKMFRADNIAKLANTQGTGLGLYLVKSIVERLGGTIAFQSEENKGSTFTISM